MLFRSAIFIGIMMFLSVISKPKGKKSALKLMTYECGEEPVSDRLGFQFNYQYFVYAIVFTALDVIAIFLYSWAASDVTLDLRMGIIPVAIFVSMLVAAFVYVAIRTRNWKKNVI